MSGSLFRDVDDRMVTEMREKLGVLVGPSTVALGDHKDDILIEEERVDGDEEGNKTIIEIMEEVPSVPGRTEYQGWTIMCDFTLSTMWS
jgi:hypothetical protein